MAQPQPDYRPVVDDRSHLGRTHEQAAAEHAATEAAETLLNIEQAIRRADRARRAVPSGGAQHNLHVALDAAVGDLEAARKRLFEAAYFGGDQQRIL